MLTHHRTSRTLLAALLAVTLFAQPVSALALAPDSGKIGSTAAAPAPAAFAPASLALASVSAPGPVVIDYTGPFRSSTPSRLRRGGVGIVIRYVGSAKWKCLTRREANALRRAGIDIAAVYETKAGWMLGGYKAGVTAAKRARAAVRACGGPRTPFVYFACDVATKRYSTVNACLRGAASVLGRNNVGIYGSYSVCDNALKSGWATKAWQTEAWSYGKSLASAALYQNARRCDGYLGLDYDSNFARAEDLGQWGYKGAGRISWMQMGTATGANLKGVEFVSATTGCAVGTAGTVIRSTDGGSTWQARSTPTTATLWAVDFATSSAGWAVGAGGAVVRTGDGGLTWEARSVPTSETLRAVCFADATRGWAVGDAGTVLATYNGGSTWSTQTVPTSAILTAARFVGATTGWLAGEGGLILHTTDGGVTWNPQSTPTSAALSALDFVDAETGWAVGKNGTILATTNGGTTWVQCSSPTSAKLSSVRFLDAMIGWAVGDAGTLVRTVNGGATWSAQSVPSTGNLSSVSFVEGAKGWIAGDSGTVLKAIGTGTTPYATITGVARSSKSGKPVGGVRVRIGSRLSAPTSPDGTFIAARMLPGTYSVGFTDPRYVSRSVAGVVARSGVRASVKVSLTPRTATALTRPVTTPTLSPRGLPVSATTTLTPSVATTAAPVTFYGWRYEQKTVRKKVRGHLRKVKVWHWRLAFKATRYASANGSVSVGKVFAPGRWHLQARFAGTGTLLPSTSATVSFRVL